MSNGRLGPYEIEEVLGQGGMGTVYRARLLEPRHGRQPGETVAVKVLHPALLLSSSCHARFVQEARLGLKVKHPNVVRTYGQETVDAEGRRHELLVMEFGEGQTLRALLDEGGQVPEALAHAIARSLADGLRAIHAAGAVHRDLKPENVLITREYEVKLMDLGVAHLQGEMIRLTRTEGFAGSVAYAAPEQFHDSKEAPDGRSDLFSLGVVLYELVTKLHPFEAADAKQTLRRVLEVDPRKVGELNPQISPFFEEIVATLLAKAPEARFPSAQALVEVLEEGESGTWWAHRAKELRRALRRPLRSAQVPHESAVYGREAELDVLVKTFDRARRGEGQVVLLRGEAGIGKTRLVDELVRRLGQTGLDPDVLLGAYPPGGMTTYSGAFSTAFREHLGPEHLREALGELFGERWFLLPALEALLTGVPLPTDADPMSRDALHGAFVRMTQQLSEQRPLVILIDDLHNAPEEGRALFAQLAHGIASQQVLLVGCGRHQLPAAWTAEITAIPHAQQLELERLGALDLHRLLTDALGTPQLVRDIEPSVALKSGGNPFFVFEILRSLGDKGRINRRPDGTWTALGRTDVVEIPSSLHDLIQARLAGLGDEEREVLEVAACCGFEFDPLLVADVIGDDRIPALRRLGRIEADQRLVRSRGRTFVFDHHQLLEVLYASLSPLLREEYHHAIARELERRLDTSPPPGARGRLAVEICRHRLRSASPRPLEAHLDAALDHLEEGHQVAAASRLAEEVLERRGLLQGEKRFALLMRQNYALGLAGRRERQTEILTEAGGLADQLDSASMRARVEMSRAHLAFGQGQLEEARRHFHTCLEAARASNDEKEEGGAESGLGLVAYREARFEDALRHFQHSHEVARARGNRSAAASALGNLGVVSQALGRHEEALGYLEQVLAAAKEMGDLRLQGKCHDNLGILFQGLGRVDEARRSYARAVEVAEEVGDRQSQAVGRVNLGSALREQDRLAEALDCLTTAMEIGREIGDPVNEAISLDNLGELYRVLGDYARAREDLEAALSLCRKVGSKRDEGYVLENLGRLAEDEGHLEEAQSWLERAVTLRREIAYPVGEASALAALGRVSAQRGDTEHAIRQLDLAIRIAKEHEATTELLRAKCERAVLPGGTFQDAVKALEELGDKVHQEDALRGCFLLWQATRDPALLERARQRLDARLASAPPDRRRNMRERVPLHRAILDACASHDPSAA